MKLPTNHRHYLCRCQRKRNINLYTHSSLIRRLERYRKQLEKIADTRVSLNAAVTRVIEVGLARLKVR